MSNWIFWIAMGVFVVYCGATLVSIIRRAAEISEIEDDEDGGDQ